MAHPSQLSRSLYSLTINGSHLIVKCWKLTRTDATVFRFTDHSTEVVIGSDTYTPIGSGLASAEEGQDGLKPGNREFVGIIRSDKITEDDLRAGRFRGTKVEEFIVDPRWPWIGNYRSNLYWIQEVLFNGETWVAQLEGPLNRLRVTKGFTYERRCRWKDFGDENCTVDVDALKQAGRSPTTIIEARKDFESDIVTGQGNDYFNDGKITWLTGDNVGLISDVKQYIEQAGVIRLFVETIFELQLTDTFDIRPGCDRQFSTCIAYNNKDNFGGFPDIPGNDDIFTVPDAR